MLRKLFIALLLLVTLVLPAAANEYREAAYGIYVDFMELVENEDGTRQINFTLPNLNSHPISKLVIDVVMLDDDYQPVLDHPNDMEGFMQELSTSNVAEPLSFTPPLEPNKDGSYSISLGNRYKNATKARAAVSYYQRESGEEFYLSPTVMLWNHSDGTRREPGPGGLYYPGLTKEEQDLAYSFPMGFNTSYTPLSEEMAPLYNKSRGGFWVLSVKEGSLAQKLGLLPGDVLVSVDGVDLAEDLRAIELGKIKMAKGETIIFTWLRDGELLEGQLSKD